MTDRPKATERMDGGQSHARWVRIAHWILAMSLLTLHDAPVRLRVARQMGYKSMKYLQRIVVTDRFDDGGASGNIENGWAWYTGI